MKEQFNFALIKEQAKRMKKDCPELFNYLVRRDEANAELTRAIFDSIPRPDDIPTIRIPFIEAVIELLAPQKQCPVCDDEDSLWLTPKLRARLCEICRNGVYVRGSGVGSLAD
jgi:hypothetical protein